MRTSTKQGRRSAWKTCTLAAAVVLGSASMAVLPENTAVGAQSEAPNIWVSTDESIIQVGGFSWYGDDVAVTIDDPNTEGVEKSFAPVSPVDGQFSLEERGLPVDAGWVVTATNGTTSKTLDLVDLTIDRVDTSDGRVEGTGPAGATLELIAMAPDPEVFKNVTVNSFGEWNDVLPLPVAGGNIGVNYFDSDGDFMGGSFRWPSIGVSLSDDIEEDGSVSDALIGGGNWPPGAEVHVVVDDPSDVYDRDFNFAVTEWGELDHWALGETGIPNDAVGDGWTVTATTTAAGWTTEKSHTITRVRVNDTDHRTGVASGVCDPAVPELYVGLVSGRWPGEGYGVLDGCDDGTWSVDWIVDQFDVPFVTAGRRDADWDSTSFMNFQDRPRVLYEAATGTVTFIYWNGEDVEVLLDETLLTTIEVSGELWYRTTLEEHGVSLGTVGPDSILTFQTSTELKAMLVKPVTIDTVDPDGTVHGTASAYAEVTVGIANAYDLGRPAEPGSVTADEFGNWTSQIDVSQLEHDHVVRATVVDYDNDANVAEFEPPPRIVVRPIDNIVVAFGFQQGEMVTVTVEDPDNGVLFSVDRQIQDPQQAHLELFDEETGEEWDVVAHEVVTVTGESGTATHVVTELTTTGADADTGVVTGSAAAGSEVVVNVNDEPIWRVVEADEATGQWTANFAELQPGMEGQAEQQDEAGNSTAATWRVPEPTLEVDPFEDIVVLNEVPPGTRVDILVNGSDAGFAISEPWGNSYWQAGARIDVFPMADMSAGDEVEAIVLTGEDVTMIVGQLAVDGRDDNLQSLTGTANPGAEVFIHGGSEQSDAQRRVTADEAGRWTADFATEPEPAGEGQEPAGYGTVDVASLRWLDVSESSGFGTTIYRRDERPTLFMFPAERTVWTFNWYPLDPIDLFISSGTDVVHQVLGLEPVHGPSPITIGDVTLDLDDMNSRALVVYELPEGVELGLDYKVTVSDALMTVTGTVGEIVVDEADLEEETLSGTTAAATPFVFALDAGGHVGPAEPVGGAWTTQLCTPDSLEAGVCDAADLTHESAGIVLAFSIEESIDETATGATWSMAPRILSINALVTAERKTETTVVVTVADIERPDVQSVTVDWGEKKNDNDKDTSIAWLADPNVPTDLEFTHIYTTKGTFTVTVTMTDAGGSSTTQTITINITKA